MDLERFLGELAEWAEERDPGFETHAYGSDAEQVADFRRGDDRIAVLVHGGFWRAAYTRANTRALAVDLALRGWTTWNIEYRRVGNGGGVPETLEDVEAALAVAGRRALVIGHSAGGHLALWAAGTGRVAAAVSLAGVTDLVAAVRDGLGNGAAVDFAGDEPPAHADPMQRLPLPVPVLVVHGARDDRVPVDYSRRYAAASGCELLELSDVGHFELIDPRTDAWKRVALRLRELL